MMTKAKIMVLVQQSEYPSNKTNLVSSVKKLGIGNETVPS
jgi:hypothetical protein